MYHNGPSDNDIRTEIFNNQHLLKEDFGTSVVYVRWDINLRCQQTMASETTAPYLRLDQNDKFRIPTYQADIEPAMFIIHSQLILI
jgi:hypothetical protein